MSKLTKTNLRPDSDLPAVEVDTEAGAAYIRLALGKVARTEVYKKDNLVTFDYDKDGGLLGVEIIGTNEYTFNVLTKRFPPLKNIAATQNVRYVAARKVIVGKPLKRRSTKLTLTS
jgi:uncharacterized protein YuzE